MYLIPRLIGVGIFALTLLLTCVLISHANRNQMKIILFFYLIALTLMGFFFIPPPGSDLYRLLPIMYDYAEVDFLTILSSLNSTTTPMLTLYYYVLGQFRVDGLLAGVTVLIFYCNCFYILIDYAKRYQVSSRDVALVLFLFMARGSFGEVIDGIRTMLAFSIIAVCCYREFVCEKSIIKHIPLYIVASLFHPAALALTTIRVLFLFFQGTYSGWNKVKHMVLAALIVFIGLYYGKEYLGAMTYKAISYFTNVTYSYFWETILGIISLILVFWFIRITGRYKNRPNAVGNPNNLIRFISFMLIIAIVASIFDYNTFHRIEIFVSILTMPILMGVLKNQPANSSAKRSIYNTVLSVSFILLLIACSRGNLCSLKFFK